MLEKVKMLYNVFWWWRCFKEENVFDDEDVLIDKNVL